MLSKIYSYVWFITAYLATINAHQGLNFSGLSINVLVFEGNFDRQSRKPTVSVYSCADKLRFYKTCVRACGRNRFALYPQRVSVTKIQQFCVCVS